MGHRVFCEEEGEGSSNRISGSWVSRKLLVSPCDHLLFTFDVSKNPRVQSEERERENFMEREKKNMALDGDHESVRVVVKLVEHKAREVSDFVKRVF